MTREEHLKFCKKCINRKLDINVGLLCNITGEKADFEDECRLFKLDDSVVAKMDDTAALEHNEVLNSLSDKDINRFRSEQDFPKAIMTGAVVGILGAILWGAVTVTTGLQIGYIAMGIGAGIGFSMRFMGKGIDQNFGIASGLIALLSCLLGNFLSIIGFIANAEGLGYFETLTLFDYNLLIPVMSETFSFKDILFYGVAASVAYKFSFRTFTEKDLYELEK